MKDICSPDGPQPAIVALAKERHRSGSRGSSRPERVFLLHVKDPIELRTNTAELFLLTKLRDEAHRIAIRHHKVKRSKSKFLSELDAVPGIGAQRKRQLLKHVGSVDRIRQASVRQLASVPGMTSAPPNLWPSTLPHAWRMIPSMPAKRPYPIPI